LLALAVALGEIGAEEAWKAAHIDEDWNAEQWGQDAEAVSRHAGRRRDMMAAVRLLAALGNPAR
jgi:chaperone required for assembly of F1-ATPase